MELVFIRHGQGEHTLDVPKSLQIEDPALTSTGVEQAMLLRNQFPLTDEDVIIISPLRRTLETVFIWSENKNVRKIVSPLVSPRIFPIHSSMKTLPCDKIMDLEIIEQDYPTFEVDSKAPIELWSDGINTLTEQQFTNLAEKFISDCKKLHKEKIYIVSHDGTITSYRQMLSGQMLTRNDFPKETGWFSVIC
ncbi:histidine phosphatase family protein [Viridibacillus sp. FSL R5-0477]|uniref:Phosphoglycerate mutase n=1 Tax=Viridibacillus arenosi FSL R5-213 TaxID=1227360 RepID=W4F2Q5_9BACL|nr:MULTISPECIES: histidine phosphatase family protein [Viridibacillus]ETT86769.1 phosphoglycerate mutase [Viridibacillus arenosi FSL R5-213]OMC83424.1 histidine phosphatase family protein [Viridibacillus sp. FSL H8-0123]OMC84411.1 histidine phosphatase family protein [Viridibacillus sp. FSL H7-0596]OMC89466.1 histidine phosphatase family protein [Viridibacillus arenosi]